MRITPGARLVFATFTATFVGLLVSTQAAAQITRIDPLGSGGMESANKFICHVRLKRSGAWWYEVKSNQMLALRCAKYNGTFQHVFERYRQEKLGA